MGAPPAQSELCSQPTQVPLGASQTGLGDVHCEVLLDEHCVHAPWSDPLVWHAGVGTLQSASLPHGPQVCVPVLQTGVTPPQFALLVHWTHTLVVPLSKQTGPRGLPMQSALVAQMTHWP